MKKKFQNSGFTLIELLIGMAIITILAAVTWGNFSNTLIKGRDSRRKQDLESISKALELYYNDTKIYPTAIPGAGTPFVNPVDSTVVYMQKVPSDPQGSSKQYCLISADGSYYKVYTRIENERDPALLPTITCNSVSGYNFGVSSQNTIP